MTDSWRSWYEAKETEEWMQSVAGVLDQGWNDQYVVAYSFPWQALHSTCIVELLLNAA